MWIFAIIALFTGAVVLVLVVYLAGQIVPPLYDVVVNDPSVQALGYDVGAQTAVDIGFLVPPLLALSITFWLLLLRLRQDTFQGQQTRRRR